MLLFTTLPGAAHQCTGAGQPWLGCSFKLSYETSASQLPAETTKQPAMSFLQPKLCCGCSVCVRLWEEMGSYKLLSLLFFGLGPLMMGVAGSGERDRGQCICQGLWCGVCVENLHAHAWSGY